ncbi:formin-like protein 6 [Acanthaster planci]|uniref:Formin-like protein 6 n=1 Tax=Acanthaster planci TaxID=133434 RepID=A0A8B7XMM2_ACAPL|nr:formin-like protein 6 [Acanthaster planci]
MEKENFFTKLRRVATSTESETTRLKMCMEKPAAVRTASSSNYHHGQEGSLASSRLVLKEMQFDAQKMKEKVNQQLKELSTSSDSFEEIVDACQGLCEVTQQQLTDLETHLAQYGYKKYHRKETQHVQQGKTQKQDKENTAPETHPETVKDTSSTEEKIPSTPTKVPSSAPPVDPNKTPQLADFGISQWTIDRLAHVGLNGTPQDLKTGGFPGSQYGSVTSAIPSHVYPSTPQQQSQKPWQRTPFTNRTILVTPGLFGDQTIPTETPQQFIDSKSYLLDSPVPPVLMSTQKSWPITSDLRVTSRRNNDVISPEPEPPTVTMWAEHIPLPAPPTQLHVPPNSADTTPPMPLCLASQATQAPMPAEPACLVDRFTSEPLLPCEPVQLYHQFSTNKMPTEPIQLTEKFARPSEPPAEPVQLAERFGSEFHLPQEPQVLNGSLLPAGSGGGQPSQPATPKGHQRLATLAMEHEMPQTPELTVTHQRFLEIKPTSGEPVSQPPRVSADSIPFPTLSNSHDDVPKPPVLQSMYSENQVTKAGLEAQQTSVANGSKYSVTPVTDAEFGQVADYLQRLFPLDVINQKVADINAMLAQNKGVSFLNEADMQGLQLGSKTRAFSLLLAKLRRLSMGKKPDSGEMVFYVIN